MKPGYKTTELWLSIIAGVLVAVRAVPTPHNASGWELVAIVGAYALSRGVAKLGGSADPIDLAGDGQPPLSALDWPPDDQGVEPPK